MNKPPAASLDEIRALLKRLPSEDTAAAGKAAEREAQLTKPAGSLGRLESLSAWLCAWQGQHPPKLDHPRVAVFAGNHGVAARGVSAFPPAVTAQMVQNFTSGGAAINQLCQAADADLRVYEMALDQPTKDFTEEPAMSDAECARAMAYGMMAVEPGLDLICLGEMGIANTTSAAALCLALFGGTAEEWVGPGTGVAGTALQRKKDVVAAGVALHRDAARDPLDILARLGGRELAAIVRRGDRGAHGAHAGAARWLRLDGRCGGTARRRRACAGSLRRRPCLGGARPWQAGGAHRQAAAARASNMRLGEASGAALAISILKAAVACHTGMATFAEAGVSGKV